MVARNLSKKRLMLKQKLACSRHQSYIREISAVHVATNQLTSLWPSHRPPLSETSAITQLKSFQCVWQQNDQTLRPLVKPPTRRLEGRKRVITIKHKFARTPASRLLMSIWLKLLPGHVMAEIKRMQARPSVSTITRREILGEIVPNLERTGAPQKTSINLSHICSNDWH